MECKKNGFILINMKESYSYNKLNDNKVQCKTCSRNCLISSGDSGFCGVRKNINGKLYNMNYGKVFSYGVDPIEKKPLFHFLPGSSSFSFASVGCNMCCKNCQNWKISQEVKKNPKILESGEDVSPERIVEYAIENNCKSISYTYGEPTIFFEYALDVMKIAKSKNIKNVWVTNGFMSSEVISQIEPYLDAANIDIKFFNDEDYKEYCCSSLQDVLRNAENMKKKGVWVEITTLIIPGINDDDESVRGTANFILDKLGKETPWHLSAFCGEISWKMKEIPSATSDMIERVCEIGRSVGLENVYSGNIIGDKNDSTFCPDCGNMCIRRIGYIVERFDKKGVCSKCGKNLSIIE